MKLLLVFFFASLLISTAMPAQEIKYLALGDSYTIGESVAEAERWPEQWVTQLRARGVHISKPRIIATTGWRTDQLKKAVEEAHLPHDFGLVTLLIGVNNQYQNKSVESYAPEFEELLQMAISLAGGEKKHVVVLSIPDYGYTPFGKPKLESISKAIVEFNNTNREITARAGVKYVNITDFTQKGLDDPSLVAPDGLHPSGKCYALWVQRLMKEVVVANK